MSNDNRGYILRIVAIICYIAAFIGVSLRFYVRKYVVGKLGHEDWLMGVGLALYTMYIALVMVGLHYGTGQHHRDLPNHDITMAVKYWYFCEWAYVLTTTVIKYAVGVFYLRIMVQRWQILVVKTVMLAVIVFGVAYFGCVVAQCVPVPFIWLRFALPETYQGSCLPDAVILWGTYLHSILSASADWSLGLLPITLLWNVRMGWGTKAMMCLVLGLGAIASTSTLVRLSVIHTITDLDDFLWDTLGIAIWSTVEPGVALLAAGLATIRPLLRSLFPKLFNPAINLDFRPVSSLSAFDCHPPDVCRSPSVISGVDNGPPVLPHIQPLRSPPPLPYQSTGDEEKNAVMNTRVPFPFPFPPPPIPSILENGDERGVQARPIRLMGFGAGLGTPSTSSKHNSTSSQMLGFGAGVGPGQNASLGVDRSSHGNATGMGGIRRAKSWRSVTTAKSCDSRATKNGYGNITIVYAESSRAETGKEALRSEEELDGDIKEQDVGDKRVETGHGLEREMERHL